MIFKSGARVTVVHQITATRECGWMVLTAAGVQTVISICSSSSNSSHLLFSVDYEHNHVMLADENSRSTEKLPEGGEVSRVQRAEQRCPAYTRLTHSPLTTWRWRSFLTQWQTAAWRQSSFVTLSEGAGRPWTSHRALWPWLNSLENVRQQLILTPALGMLRDGDGIGFRRNGDSSYNMFSFKWSRNLDTKEIEL